MAFTFTLKGQNLVPNYSFEQLIHCSVSWGSFNGYVTDWTGQDGGGGLSYFTRQCPGDSVNGGSVPYNYYHGFQYAHTGVSYAGIVTFITSSITDTTFPYGKTSSINQRSYIEAMLTTSLKTGVTYYVSFFVNLQNSCDYACSDIGAYFSDSALSFNGNSVKSYLTPQVTNDPKKKELTDTMNWMKVSGSFIASGGEKYIIIGNFKNDSLSSIKYLGQVSTNTTESWYYVDDVIVSPDSAYADSLETVSVQNINNPKEEVIVFPNPSNGLFNIEIRNGELGINNTVEVYNMLGEKIYDQLIMDSGLLTIDLKGQPEGLYLYRVLSEKGELIGSGKLIIQ